MIARLLLRTLQNKNSNDRNGEDDNDSTDKLYHGLKATAQGSSVQTGGWSSESLRAAPAPERPPEEACHYGYPFGKY